MASGSDTLSIKAYQHIQRKLLSGEWMAGDVLSEHSVAQELGISRTPVREAFRDLEQEGLLEQVPRFGTRVKALDRRDLVELYELREALEPYAVAQAAGRLSSGDAGTLEALCGEFAAIAAEMRHNGKVQPDEVQMKRLMSADMAFHQLLIRAGGNRRMMKIVAEGRVLASIFSTSRQEHDLKVVEQTLAYHREILKAVLTGDGDTGRRLMAEHIRASLNEALEHFDRVRAAAESRALPLGLPEALLPELQRITRNARPAPAKKRSKAS